MYDYEISRKKELMALTMIAFLALLIAFLATLAMAVLSHLSSQDRAEPAEIAPAPLLPLGTPETRQVCVSSLSSTLEYSIPTFNVFNCPMHGEVTGVVIIKDQPYCEQCLWERVLSR